jgi:hypothetical protein
MLVVKLDRFFLVILSLYGMAILCHGWKVWSAVDIFVMRCACMSGSAEGAVVGRLSFRVNSRRVGIEKNFT